MKRLISALSLACLLATSALAAPSALWENYSYLTVPPPIDAIAFDNHGMMSFMNTGANYYNTYDGFVFDTQNTRYFTNCGTMSGSLGFRFDWVKPISSRWTRVPADNFINTGNISGVDNGALAYGYGFTGVSSTTTTRSFFYGNYGTPSTVASYLLVNANNVQNTGLMSVGELGLMQLTGNNIDLRRGVLSAGSINSDTNSTYSGWYNGYYDMGRGFLYGNGYYSNPPDVNDIYWGAGTNTDLYLPFLANNGYFQTSYDLVWWSGGYGTYLSLPLTAPANFDAWAYTNNTGSNIYVTVVFVKTNSLNTNMVIDVRFPNYNYYYGYYNNYTNSGAQDAIVRFGSISEDIVTGQTVTNACYLIDTGATQPNIFLRTNIISENTYYSTYYAYQRPSCFEITTGMPSEWWGSSSENFPYSPDLIYPGHTYTNMYVSYTYGAYGAQVGRDTESIDSSVANYVYDSTNFLYGYTNGIVLTDPTNQAGRIEINAGKLDLSYSRIRSEGLLSLKAKDLISTYDAIMDAGTFVCDLGSSTGSLSISNLFPSAHARVGGNIYAWCANWENSEVSATATNNYKFHVLVVDHALKANIPPTIRSMALRATNVYAQDNMRVVRNYLFDTENLTLNGPVTLLEEASSFTCVNAPKLKNFLNDTNGVLSVASQFCLGYDIPKGILSCTNRGLIGASLLQIKAGKIENSGSMTVSNLGSLYITADSINLTTNPVLTYVSDPITLRSNLVPTRSTIVVDWDTFITTKIFRAQNSLISNGIAGFGKLTLTATAELSDSIPGVPGVNNVLNNFWEVQNGFSVPVKPPVGDLFGTQIKTAATNWDYCTHIWPGEDRGATVLGFTNNLVIGRLVVDRQTKESRLYFKGAGKKNAMYVDFLELQDFSFDEYAENALSIDDNLTIYFADSNADPSKLERYYPGRLVWVREFAGPNSSALVAANINGQTRTIFVNRALAQSESVDSDGDGIVNRYDPFPFDGAVLTVKLAGQGRVTPDLDMKPLVLGSSYNLTAIPAPGYIFTGWSAGVTSSAPSISITMTRDLSLTANFTAVASVLPVANIGDGQGKITPDTSSTLLTFGRACQLSAAALPGNLFAGWKIISGSSNTVVTQPILNFVMRADLTVQVIFNTNHLLATKGAYSGLLFDTNAPAIESSGAVNFSLTEKGTSSGRLTMPSGAYAFNPIFNQNGLATLSIKRSKTETLTFNLKADFENAGQVTGTVVATNAGTRLWTATLLANRSEFNVKTNPAPLAAAYTMAFRGNVNDATNTPGGDGYANLAVSKLGAVAISGYLADNINFGPGAIQSVPVSKTGQWPFFATFGGKEVIFGWLSFDAEEIAGKLHWIKKANYGTYYKNGFTNLIDIIGSYYTAPAKGVCALDAINAVAIVSGGNLTLPQSWSVSYKNQTCSYNTSDNSVKLTIAPSNGKFSFSFVNPGGKALPFNGVVLQKQNIARGYFLGASQSGQVLLQGE